MRGAPTGRDEAAIIAGTLAYGLLLQRVIPEAWHGPANMAAALASLAAARRAGVSTAECGVARADMRAGISTGAAAGLIAAAGVTMASLPEATRRLFSQERVTAHRTPRAACEVLVRIPLSTALSEEALFRGAMLGVMLRRHPPAAAVGRASLCFGVWHVLPALASLRGAVAGRRLKDRFGAAAAVAGAVGVTSAAGAALAALRLRSGSVLAPTLAHAALNASAYLAARRAG